MKKSKLLMVFLIVTLGVIIMSFTASAEEENGYIYALENGEATIVSVSNVIRDDVILPSTLGGCPVVSIADNAFYDKMQHATSITIPETVKSIGDDAFGRSYRLLQIIVNKNNEYFSNDEYGVLFNKDKTELIRYPIGHERTEYFVPNSVTSIREEAFSSSALEAINVSANNEYFSSDEYGVLYNKDKTKLIQYPTKSSKTRTYIIPNGVISINDYAFERCYSLTNVTIPNCVTSIGDGAFFNCQYLGSIEIPNSVTTIGKGAFNSCMYLREVTMSENVKVIEEGTFGHCANLKDMIIPNSVIDICSAAFYYCNSLENIVIGENVKTIGDMAFYSCPEIVNINIPSSVTYIGESAFDYCDNCTTITVDENNDFYSSDEYGVLFNKDKTELIRCSGGNKTKEYVVPNSVIKIYKQAFSNCKNLMSITVSDGVLDIGDRAFENCKSLREATIGKGISYLGQSTFADCYNLTNVKFSEGLTNIGVWTFGHCNNLESVTIPRSVISIDSGAFYNCTSLKDIYYGGFSEAEWDAIFIDKMNEYLENATIHYSICVEHNKADFKKNVIKGKEATCTETGKTDAVVCANCGIIIEGGTGIPATGHTDSNHDGKCDKCGYDMTQNCSCKCHKGGFTGFFWKITNFFQKLFGKNKVCACGMAH